MAIPFLNNINLDDNQLQNAKLHVTSSAPTAAAAQIYFDSTVGVEAAKYYSNATDQWVTLSEYGFTGDTFITVTKADTNSTDAKQTVTVELSATGTPSSTTYLRGDNTWAAVVDTDTTYDLSGYGSTNGTAGIQLVGSDATTDQVAITGAGTTTVTQSANTITITSNDQYTGTLTGVTEGAGITVTASATSPTVAVDYLGADNYLLEAGAATTAASTDIINFSDSDDNNVKQTTLGNIPVEALADVKTYIDNSVAGGVYYQGGYDAATNTPNLDSSPTITIDKGFMWTVTADGLFFTEQVRVGDVLIAEIDSPTALSDWTTVQNNVDLATLTTVGLGNVNAGTGISVSYSNGTATVTNIAAAPNDATITLSAGTNMTGGGDFTTDQSSPETITFNVPDSSASTKGAVIVAAGTGINVFYDGNGTATVSADNTATSKTGTITAGNTSGSVTHTFGINTMVQTFDSSGNTVYCDVARTTTSVTASIATAQAGDITILVQKIG